MKKVDFLYLSERDVIDAGVLNYKKCMSVIEEVFLLLAEGDYLMGGKSNNKHGMRIDFPKESKFPNMPLKAPDRRFMAMLAYIGGRFNVCGEKWYGSNIANSLRDLPRSILTIFLNDPETCEPLCLLSGNLVSSMRTGAVAGIGAKYLVKKDAKVCSIIGCGLVNKSCFKAIYLQVKTLEKVALYNLSRERAVEFSDWIKSEMDLEVVICDTLEEAIKCGDVISIAASRKKPVEIKDDWIKKGCTLILSGYCKLDENYWLNSKNIFDNAKMHKVYMEDAVLCEDREAEFDYLFAGELYRLIYQGKHKSINECDSMGDVIVDPSKGRLNDEEKITFITGGMAVFDIGWGYELYQNALKQSLGQKLLLWEGDEF